MRYQYLRLHAPEAQPERPRERQDSVNCPASSNPYPDYEGALRIGVMALIAAMQSAVR